ncbi:transmembrane amino acid transporter protein [Ditylenchus destructor]|nr:transmembrane amino acid transporter protein [Ditylenchus destructor]
MKDKNQKNQEGYSLVSNSANTVETGCGKKFRNVEGMSWIVTCLFIVGETAGGGLIAMPTAMVSAGLIGGVFIIIVGAIVCAYTGDQLSENWTILQERWPEYRNHCRKPYPAMGLRALGPGFASVVSSCLNVTQFGTAVVFLLLAAKNIESFIHSYFGVHVGFCYLVIFVAIFMLPFTLLKSPKDFWWAVIGAMITTSIAVCLIIYGSILDYDACIKEVNYAQIVPTKFFMCFGTVMFAYGGHGAFPTIQHDMKKPYQFKRSVFTAFLIVICMYLPVSVMGFITYGDSLLDSIIPSLQEFYIQQTVNVLITLHVVLALTIVFNPLNQEWEELLNVPQEMGIQRVLARGAMMIAVVLVAETVPNFGVLLDLVGGSTITLMALVFPVIFNLYLVAGRMKYGDAIAPQNEAPVTLKEVFKYTPRSQLLLNGAVLLFGILGGLAATFSAMNAMLSSEFSPPCYSGIFTTEDAIIDDIFGNSTLSVAPLISHAGKFNCCGMFKNISRFGGIDSCLDPFSKTAMGGSHG